MSERDDLKAEATDLGLTFKGNISNKALKALVEGYDGSPTPISESAPASPRLKTGESSTVEDDEEESRNITPALKAKAKNALRRKQIANARAKAYKTAIVTITNKDNRENDVATSVYLSFENQFFGISKNVPLDVPVELEHSLIRIAEGTTMTLHKAELKNGKATGNKVAVTVKKFAVSYSGRQPKAA